MAPPCQPKMPSPEEIAVALDLVVQLGPMVRLQRGEAPLQAQDALLGELPEEAQEALQRVGWVEGKDDPAADALPAFTREDIPFIVQQAVADETFADERSKDMFQDEMREKLLKQLLEGEVQSEFGVGLQDLLNPIKVVSLEKKILAAKAKLYLKDDNGDVEVPFKVQGA